MLLTFYISDNPLIEFEVNHNNQTLKCLNYYDEKALEPIFARSQISYNGVEERLQYMLDTNKTFAQITEQIAEKGLCVPFQINLKATVTE